MKKKMAALVLAGAMVFGLVLFGCGNSDSGTNSDTGTDSGEDAGSDAGSDGDSGSGSDEGTGEKPYAGINLKWWGGNTENNTGTQAVMAAATEKLCMEFEVEINPGGTEGDNI